MDIALAVYKKAKERLDVHRNSGHCAKHVYENKLKCSDCEHVLETCPGMEMLVVLKLAATPKTVNEALERHNVAVEHVIRLQPTA